MAKKIPRWALWTGGVFAGLLVVSALLPDTPEQKAEASRIAEARRVAALPKPPPPVVIESWSKLGVYQAGKEALSRGRKGNLNEPVIVQVRLKDAYGKETTQPGFTLSWSAADLERIDWKGMDEFRLLNLAKLRDGGVDGVDGAAALNVWCRNREKYVLTPALCRQWRAALE
jgi:hypothetical protein